MHRTIPLLPLCLALAACASPAAGPAPPQTVATAHEPVDAQSLASRHWRLVEAFETGGGRIDALFPDPAGALQLRFAEGRVAISGGCNRMSGSYTIAAGKLSFGPLAQTKMFCGGGALMAADDAIAAQLARPLSATMEADRLVLSTAEGARLVFEGAAIPATP